MDGMLIDALIKAAEKQAAGKKLLDLRLGLGYTAALLDDGSARLAFTFRRELGNQCSPWRRRERWPVEAAPSYCPGQEALTWPKPPSAWR